MGHVAHKVTVTDSSGTNSFYEVTFDDGTPTLVVPVDKYEELAQEPDLEAALKAYKQPEEVLDDQETRPMHGASES